MTRVLLAACLLAVSATLAVATGPLLVAAAFYPGWADTARWALAGTATATAAVAVAYGAATVRFGTNR
ncbi:hypothetical protein [Actinoallomurus sp. NPDC052274]|uniref:hypothetical protein n=1 Tax=Actinoallomurus sp. NPDC052274 TaxID=3155420 RepID=UPI00343013A1